MSDFTAKNQRGLMEAYASMYQQPVQEDKVEDVEYEEYEINTDALYESIVNYLVSEGYVETEKKALAMIPHLSEEWFNNIAGNIIISEALAIGVNSLLEEGYDLSSYTWDELYEEYTGHLSNVIAEEYNNLNEVAGALAPALSTPLGAGAALGAAALSTLGKIKKDVDYLRTSKQWGYGDPAAERWLNTGSFEARKETDPARVKASRQAAARANQRRSQQQTAQTPVGKSSKVASPAQQAGPGAGPGPGGGSGSNEPPKGPNFFQRALTKLSSGMKQAGAPAGKNPLISAGGKALETTGKGIWKAPGAAVQGVKALGKPGFWTGALKNLGWTTAGAVGTGGGGELLRKAGQGMSGFGSALQGAPGEVKALQQGVSAYQKAKERANTSPAPASQPGSTSAIDKLKKLQ